MNLCVSYGQATVEAPWRGRAQDICCSLNILRKSKVVSLSALYNRGVVDTPAFT